MAGPGNAPIIIKRKKIVSGDGHHGGAWKVAYADFVTAMMAFFMLMWLLNATTDKQRKGIADFFSPTVPVARVSGGGEGVLGGDTPLSENTLVRDRRTGATFRDPAARRSAAGDAAPPPGGAGEGAALDAVARRLTARSGESMVSDRLQRHILTRLTDEGLIVELFALPGAPLFEGPDEAPTDLMRDLVAVVAEVFGLVPNRIALKGFVRSAPVVLRDNPIWDRSAARAQATRRLLPSGLARGRLDRVSGLGDRTPSDADPMAVRNDRVELILLRSDR